MCNNLLNVILSSSVSSSSASSLITATNSLSRLNNEFEANELNLLVLLINEFSIIKLQESINELEIESVINLNKEQLIFHLRDKYPIRYRLFEWLFMYLDLYIINNCIQNETNESNQIISQDASIIQTTQTQNRIRNMRVRITGSPSSSSSALPADSNSTISNLIQLFNKNYFYRTHILINLISLNKYNHQILKQQTIDNKDDECNLNLIEILFSNSRTSRSKDKIKLFDEFDWNYENSKQMDSIDKHQSTVQMYNNSNLKLIQPFYYLAIHKIIEHSKYLCSLSIGVYDLTIIDYLIQEFLLLN